MSADNSLPPRETLAKVWKVVSMYLDWAWACSWLDGY